MGMKDLINRVITCDRCGYFTNMWKEDKDGDWDHPSAIEGWGEGYSVKVDPTFSNRHETKILCPRCYSFYCEMLNNFFNYYHESERDDEPYFDEEIEED